jgi:Ca2+-binding RTX toxin-like protein
VKAVLVAVPIAALVACTDGPTGSDGRFDPSDLAPNAAKMSGTTCFGRTPTIIAVAGVTTTGTPGADVILGSAGDDVIDGMGGHDYICGYGGDDAIFGGVDAEAIDGGLGNDLVECGQGDDLCEGGDGDDTVRGNMGNDRVRGNLGANDRVDGGPGRDICTDPEGGAFLPSCEVTKTM